MSLQPNYMFNLYLLCEVLPSGKIEPEGKIEVIYGLPLDLFPESGLFHSCLLVLEKVTASVIAANEPIYIMVVWTDSLAELVQLHGEQTC